MSKIVNHKAMR